MKIESISLHLLRMKLRSAFETSFGRIQTRDCILVELRAGGLTGFGECVADYDPGYSYETSRTAWHILHDFLVPAVLGQEFANPQALQQQLDFVRGHPMAKSGLEMAAWDWFGRQQNRSLQQMLGGEKTAVAVGVSVGLQASSAELLRTVEAYLNDGYRRIKIKIKPGKDVAYTQALRRAFPDIHLQVDANSAYSLAEADSLLPLDELNLLLIEQPLAEDDLWQHSRLQPRFHTPLCLDESVLSRRHALSALEMGACKIINIKAGRVGGLSEAKAIHDLCLERQIPVWCGGMLETGVGRAANLALASLPGFLLPGDISATDRYYAEDITEERFSLNPDSTINVPTGPGLGVQVNRPALERARQALATLEAKAG